MISETTNDLLYNLSRGFKGMSQGMVGGMAWGLSKPFLVGNPVEYGIKDVFNALLLSNVIGSAGSAIGDGLEFTANKFFPKPKVGLELLKEQLANPKMFASKHPVATTLALGALAIGAYHKLTQKDNKEK